MAQWAYLIIYGRYAFKEKTNVYSECLRQICQQLSRCSAMTCFKFGHLVGTAPNHLGQPFRTEADLGPSLQNAASDINVQSIRQRTFQFTETIIADLEFTMLTDASPRDEMFNQHPNHLTCLRAPVTRSTLPPPSRMSLTVNRLGRRRLHPFDWRGEPNQTKPAWQTSAHALWRFGNPTIIRV